MRQLVISLFDILTWLGMALIMILGLLGGVAASNSVGGLAGVGVIVLGIILGVLFAGFSFLVHGIHANSKRSADALERLANK